LVVDVDLEFDGDVDVNRDDAHPGCPHLVAALASTLRCTLSTGRL
jgi:hypothetical protein